MSDLRRDEQAAAPAVDNKNKPRSDASSDAQVERRRFPRQERASENRQPASPTLTPLSFSTRELKPDEQFSAWQAYMAPLMEVRRPDISQQVEFAADHTAWNLGGMLVVQQNTPPHSYMRSLAKVRSDLIDHWHVSILRSGHTWTEVDGRVSEGEPATVELRSLGHPFRGRSTQAQSLSLYLPRELLFDNPGSTEIRNNIVLSGTYTKMLVDYLDSIEANLAGFAERDFPHVVQTTRDMILTCVSSSAEASSVPEPHSTWALMERMRRFVQRNLKSSDLTTERLCRELGISRTRLYQVFGPDGGVHHYIQRRRLLAAHAALSDTTNRQPVADIAFDIGFSSAAHFSRAFSKEFGYSPREARNLTVPPYLGHSETPASTVEGTPSFDKWLRALGHSH